VVSASIWGRQGEGRNDPGEVRRQSVSPGQLLSAKGGVSTSTEEGEPTTGETRSRGERGEKEAGLI